MMLHGDISNQIGTTIAFQCVGTLIKFREHGLKDKLLNTLFGREKRAVINEKVQTIMEYIYRSTDMTIDIVVFEKDYSKQLEQFLIDRFPFNRILIVSRPSQIGSRLITGDLSYYVDDNAETRSLTNSNYAIPFSKLSHVVKISGRNLR